MGKLTVDQGYTVRVAAQVMDVGDTTLRRWVNQLKAECQGTTPVGRAMTAEQQRIQVLEAQLKLGHIKSVSY